MKLVAVGKEEKDENEIEAEGGVVEEKVVGRAAFFVSHFCGVLKSGSSACSFRLIE